MQLFSEFEDYGFQVKLYITDSNKMLILYKKGETTLKQEEHNIPETGVIDVSMDFLEHLEVEVEKTLQSLMEPSNAN